MCENLQILFIVLSLMVIVALIGLAVHFIMSTSDRLENLEFEQKDLYNGFEKLEEYLDIDIYCGVYYKKPKKKTKRK